MKTLNYLPMLEGWTTPTLHYIDNQWRIYSNGCAAFVPLEKAISALVAACPWAGEKLEELDNEPF
jgi:hypothetical protein